MAREITEARIGPTQGVQRSPSEKPTKSPDPKPGFKLVLGANCIILIKSCSIQNWAWGINSETPNAAMIKIDNSLKLSAGIPDNLTIVDKNSVKKVKLKTKPITIPIGLILPKL